MATNDFVVSNGQISRPPYLGVKPDIDLNGVSWSHNIGMFYSIDPALFESIKRPNVTQTSGTVPGKIGGP